MFEYFAACLGGFFYLCSLTWICLSECDLVMMKTMKQPEGIFFRLEPLCYGDCRLPSGCHLSRKRNSGLGMSVCLQPPLF